MELRVIIPGRTPDLVVRVVDGRPVIVPPAPPTVAAAAVFAAPAPLALKADPKSRRTRSE